jgi:probable O-glycosylation ligase (exosortase A-associated)
VGYDVRQVSMKVKEPFLDYEPLRRTPASDSVVEDPAGDFSFKKPAAAPPREEKPEMEKPVIEPANETWIHKHGHSLSYAGVFLFTTLVFFRPYELSPSLFWLSQTPFWVAVATLAVFLVTQLGLENRITARPREVNLVLLLLVTGILSIPLALEPSRAFDGFIEFLKVVLIFIVMINVVRTEKRLKRLWILVLIATCILSINAVDDYRLGLLELGGQRIKGAIGGLFDNPNDLALHLVTMFPLALALSLTARNRVMKIVYFATVFLIIGGIVVTFSRGGFLALLATGAVLLWKLVRSSRWLVPPVAAVLIVLFLAFSPGEYRTRLSTTGDESSSARLDDLKRSLFVAVRNPIFGVGMENYILFSNSNKSTHNAYTQVASEMGAAAAVLYVLFILAPFKGLRRIERNAYEVRDRRRFHYASIALQASLVGYMVASFFASVAYLWYIYYLVAYAVCLRRIYDRESLIVNGES